MLDLDHLREELVLASDDAGLAVASLVVFVVEATRPSGTTPIAYLQPAGFVRPDTVVVFRAAGAEPVARHRLTAHRLAVWRELPGIPEAALGPMLRHELEHARRWEESGTRFFEADDLLRAAVRRAGGDGYLNLPSEQEANAASAVYAAKTLSRGELGELRASPDCVGLLVGDSPPPDVVESTLAELRRRSDWGLRMTSTERAAYLEATRVACAAWDMAVARDLVAGRIGPMVELVLPASL
jgi:hypothetical protein